jgi:hypothetical protein
MPSRPSSRGDARAAERARTGEAKTAAPCRGQRISTPLEKSVRGLDSGGIGSSTWTKACRGAVPLLAILQALQLATVWRSTDRSSSRRASLNLSQRKKSTPAPS